MKKCVLICVAALLVTVVCLTPTARANVVWHDPWLNWDFINQLPTPPQVDDLDIWVDNPNWTVPATNWWAQPFNTMTPTNNAGDIDNDGDQDTRIRFSGAVIPSGATAHGGLYMPGSGKVLDAYWTSNGVKVGPSTPVTYERTRVVGDPDLFMELNIAPGFFSDPDNVGKEAGWRNIRCFVNLPADSLGLADINSSLDLDNFLLSDGSLLGDHEVTPIIDGVAYTGGDILMNDDSIKDVFLASIPPEKSNENFEALLFAEVIATGSAPIPTGAFWNLNPQSPEPATLLLLALGSSVVLRKRKRS